MKWIMAVIIVFGVGATAAPLFALPSSAGSMLREAEKSHQYFQEALSEIQIEPPAAVSSVQNSPKVVVRVIRIAGATIFKEAELQRVVAAYKGKSLTYGELEKVASTLVSYYTDKGYIVKANFPPQDISDGVVLIHLVEGKLTSVKAEVTPGTRYSRDKASTFISYAHRAGQPLSLNHIERGILMLNDLPGISATTILEPGEKPGFINVIVNVTDTPMFQGNVDVDNFGDRSSGEYRVSSDININNPLGFGDQATIKILSSYYNNYVRIGYNFPIGTHGARYSTSASYLQYQLDGDFKSIKATGYSYSFGNSLFYPIFRQRMENLYIGGSFDMNHITDEAGSVKTSERNIYVGSFSMRGDQTDNFFGGGYSTYGFVYAFGLLDISNSVTGSLSGDKAGPRADGFYSKLKFFASRHQRLLQNTSLFLSLNGQYAFKNLDVSEKMSLGGANGVRGYPSNEASGDHGLLLSTELRHDLTNRIQLSEFYDLGVTQQHQKTWTGWNTNITTPNRYILNSAGLSLSYGIPGNFFVKGSVANRLGEYSGSTGKDNDGTRREPHFWFQMSKFF
ncbi:MAG: ShlB/FhaC/HecB family hemolysin secretion/activation protein [Deltaproteobacteria bacterium]